MQVIPSVQPTHATSDMSYAELRIGPERMKGAYAYQTLLQLVNYAHKLESFLTIFWSFIVAENPGETFSPSAPIFPSRVLTQ